MSGVLTRVLKITPSNTGHTAPRRVADMEQRATEASVNNPLELSDFPPLEGATVAPGATVPQVSVLCHQ